MASFSVFSMATVERQRQSLRDRVGWLRPAAAAYCLLNALLLCGSMLA